MGLEKVHCAWCELREMRRRSVARVGTAHGGDDKEESRGEQVSDRGSESVSRGRAGQGRAGP